MSTHVRLAIVIGIALVSSDIRAATPQVRDGARASAPVVDAALATITGTVVTDGVSAMPLARAIVTVSGADLPASRSAISDDTGRFVLRRVPAGRVTITTVKRGYVAGAFGATRPGRPGTPVVLAAGQTFDATIRMAPAAVVAGAVMDEHGMPLANVRIFAVDPAKPDSLSPMNATSAATDDRGTYRLFDIAPGTYVIVAGLPLTVRGELMRRSTEEVDAIFAAMRGRGAGSSPRLPPAPRAAAVGLTFYPGTLALADATRLTLTAGDVRENLDFPVRVVPVTTIGGTVVNTLGPLPATVQLAIAPPNPLTIIAMADARPVLAHAPDASGAFEYSGIAPGHYTIFARATNTALPARGAAGGGGGGGGTIGDIMAARAALTPDALFAVEDVDVTGTPVTGVTLRLQRGARIGGRIVFDPSPSRPAPADVTGFRINLQAQPVSSGAGGMRLPSTFTTNNFSTPRADASFEMSGVGPGSYRLTATTPATATEWWLRSATAGGVDLLDTNVTATLGVDIANALLTFTDRHTTLSGTLTSAGGVPAPDYFVIVFPADPALRSSPRRVVSTRPATDGRYEFKDLPAGAYLLATLTDVEPNEWQRPEFLRDLIPASIAVTVNGTADQVQDVRLR